MLSTKSKRSGVRIVSLLAAMVVPSLGCSAKEGEDNLGESAAEVTLDPTIVRVSAPSAVVAARVNAPEPPRNVAELRHSVNRDYANPAVPAFRTTPDGRLALSYQNPIETSLRITTVLPEAVKGSAIVEQGTNVARRILSPRSFKIPTNAVHSSIQGATELGGGFLCQKNEATPKACGAANDRDCYDLVLVQEIDRVQGGLFLESIPIRVVVENPKTPNAVVANVTVAPQAEWEITPLLPYNKIAEKVSTRDGHVLAGRVIPSEGEEAGQIRFTRDNGQVATGGTMFYAYAEDACSVRSWMQQTADRAFTNLRPISAAAYDRRLRRSDNSSRYGFAAYPIRTASGRTLSETDVLEGSYPWMDKNGANYFFFVANPVLFSQRPDGKLASRFPFQREDGTLPQGFDDSPRGLAVVGSWTNGKTILLDGRVSNDDFGTPIDVVHRYGLYKQDGQVLGVRTSGGGRSAVDRIEGHHVVFNSHFVESTENVFNMHSTIKPKTARDVVWNVTRGMITDEIAFDDYMDPHVLLFAEMNASWRNGGPATTRQLDGFKLQAGEFVHDANEIRLQNSAASRSYPIASEGTVAGEARIEPVAAGGVRGRGIWLNETASASFQFPREANAALREKGFYVGVFVDSRRRLAPERNLWTFEPTGGTPFRVLLAPTGEVRLVRGASSLSLRAGDALAVNDFGWHHYGLLFASDSKVELFVDGNLAASGTLEQRLELGQGSIRLGGSSGNAQGVVGWYDELRVVVQSDEGQLTGHSSSELLCNYARGTAVGVGSASTWRSRAELVGGAHARLLRTGGAIPSGDRFLCAVNYRDEYGVSLRTLPSGVRSLRDDLLHEGRPDLSASLPRPDQTGNSFCTTCHVDREQGRPLSLLRAALTPGTVATPLDIRLQPSQPPAFFGSPAYAYGAVPAGWIDRGRRTFPVQAASGPRPILEWVLPN